jgi:sulfite dehydrogenase
MSDRRLFLRALGATAGVVALGACATAPRKSAGHVVVVGGGYAGATTAKYLRMWSKRSVEVTLIERRPQFVSCPISNLVIAGGKSLADITVSYDGLRRWGVRVIHDEVVGVDPGAKRVRLARGGDIAYDRCVLAPSVDFMWEGIPALNNPDAQSKILHAWKAGPQTVALRKQLEEMKDGGVYALAIPKMPYVCPPGPYERACLVAHYFKTNKPRSKVLILDANAEVQSKKALFLRAWQERYPGIVEYRPNSELRDVAVASRTAIFDFDSVKADVLNVIPPQRANHIVAAAGVSLVNGRWATVDWLSFETSGTPGLHVLGDAVFPAPLMPKSGHMANQHAKVAAAAILNLLAGHEPSRTPLVMNTCYSFVDPRNVVHVASVHRYDAAEKTFLSVPGAGGLSSEASELEGRYALGWAASIWGDALA